MSLEPLSEVRRPRRQSEEHEDLRQDHPLPPLPTALREKRWEQPLSPLQPPQVPQIPQPPVAVSEDEVCQASWARQSFAPFKFTLLFCRLQTGGFSKGEVFTVPNIITMTRIAASPAISWCILDSRWEMALAGEAHSPGVTRLSFGRRQSPQPMHFLLSVPCSLVGVCVAGASDWLDGAIARSCNQKSHLGSLLDPLADKILVAAVAIPMGIQDAIPMWLVALMLGRDVGLVAGVLCMENRGRGALIQSLASGQFDSFEVKPTRLSKVNTALQVCLMGTSLTCMAWQVPSATLIDPLWCVCSHV